MAPKMIGNERTGDFIFMTWQEFEQQFSIQLNEQQKSAVQSVDGPVLLLAVPGSGKTTVLVTRLGYMIYCKGMNNSDSHLHGGGNEGYGRSVCGKIRTGDGRTTGISDH